MRHGKRYEQRLKILKGKEELMERDTKNASKCMDYALAAMVV